MSFYFEVNGIPMFAKGANVIPSDALLPRVTAERYARLLEDVQRSNMNLLRVWGGGIYEDDRFYEEADKRGILIWQDLVFACTTYPHDPVFMKRVAEEVEYNARRLRNHPSLALWCGNNEIYEGIRYWGWRSKYTPEIYGEMEVGYDTLFRKRLPELIARFDRDGITWRALLMRPTGADRRAGGRATVTTGVPGTERSLLRVWIRKSRAL